jgi:hypothetical protein
VANPYSTSGSDPKDINVDAGGLVENIAEVRLLFGVRLDNDQALQALTRPGSGPSVCAGRAGAACPHWRAIMQSAKRLDKGDPCTP